MQHQRPDVRIRRHGNGKRKIHSRNHPDQTLPAEFFPSTHAVGIVVHHLTVVVHPPNDTVAQRHEKYRPYETVRKIHPQEGRKSDRNQNERPAHRRRPVLHEMRLGAARTDGLADFEFAQFANHPGSGGKTDQKRRQGRHHRPQRQIIKYAESPDVLAQPLKKR